MRILVTGATGRIGGLLARRLAASGHAVRALTRDPARAARLPAGVEAVAGDLTSPESLIPALDGVEAAYLIALAGDDYAPLRTGPEIAGLARAAGVRRVTLMTGTDDEAAVVAAVAGAGLDWTHLRPSEFMSNALGWAPSIRDEGVVRVPFAHVPWAMIDDGDIAAVAAATLVERGHAGRTYDLTGPEALTRAEGVARIAGVVGRPVRLVEADPEQAAGDMRAMGIAEDVVAFVIAAYADPPAHLVTPSAAVQRVLGRPPRSFGDWLAENAAAFRA